MMSQEAFCKYLRLIASKEGFCKDKKNSYYLLLLAHYRRW
jgi:hypothetical protein